MNPNGGAIAFGHPLSQLHGIAQRHDDHARDCRGGHQADHHSQNADNSEQHIGTAALVLHRIGGPSQRLVGCVQDALSLGYHRLLQRYTLSPVATEFTECLLV